MSLPTRSYDPATTEGRLKALFDRVASFPEVRGQHGWIDLIELRNGVEQAIPRIATMRRELAVAVALLIEAKPAVSPELRERIDALVQRTERAVQAVLRDPGEATGPA